MHYVSNKRINEKNSSNNSPIFNLLYPEESNKPGYYQLHILYSVEVTAKRLWKPIKQEESNVASVMQRLDDTLRQVNLFAQPYKTEHEIKWNETHERMNE